MMVYVVVDLRVVVLWLHHGECVVLNDGFQKPIEQK
jgi:hypothetical protein